MTYEFGEGDNESYLIGPGFDLAIPGFDYFQLNFYNRQTEGPRAGDNVWQITPTWAYTLPVRSSAVLIDRFIHWVVDHDSNYKGTRSQERRQGDGCGSKGRTQWCPCHRKKKN